jgi:hypothetical protein
MNIKDLVKVLDCNIPREGYTKHGEHFNSKGKTMITLQLMQQLSKETKNSTINPVLIPMAWSKLSDDLTLNGRSIGLLTTKIFGEDAFHNPIPSVLVYINEVIRQPMLLMWQEKIVKTNVTPINW